MRSLVCGLSQSARAIVGFGGGKKKQAPAGCRFRRGLSSSESFACMSVLCVGVYFLCVMLDMNEARASAGISRRPVTGTYS